MKSIVYGILDVSNLVICGFLYSFGNFFIIIDWIEILFFCKVNFEMDINLIYRLYILILN